LRHEQTRLNEHIERMGKDVATAAEVAMRALLAETVETRLAEFTAARDTEVLRVEVSERIAALHEEQKQMHAHLERLAQSVSAEAREREIGEHLARERKWVEARLAELVPARGGRPHTRT
jgi:response regulator RpfG family c-di-GMP phosphodiesterase